MKIALIHLPNLTLQGGNCFNTLHGYWQPPNCILAFWTSGCKIEYINEVDYIFKFAEIRSSHENCFKQFYKDNAF